MADRKIIGNVRRTKKRKPTKQEVQKMNRLRKKELIKKAKEEGVIDKTAKIMSAIYLLHSYSAVLYNDLEEMLQEYGLQLGPLEYKGKKLNQAFDSYFEDFAKMIDTEQTLNWAKDLDKFGELFNEFAGLTPRQNKTDNKHT